MFWLLDLFFVSVPLFWLWREKGYRAPVTKKKLLKLFNALGFKKEQPKKTIKKAIFLFSLLLFLVSAISVFFSLIGLNDTSTVSEKILELLKMPWLVFYLLTIRITSEEVFFRGFLVPKIGVIGSAILFGLAHIGYGSIVEVIASTVVGCCLSYYYKHSKTLPPIILAHGAYNFAVISFLM